MANLKDLFQDALPIIEKAAPTIGGIIGGPAGMAATFILSLLAKTFDTKPNEINKLVDNIVADPKAEYKLQELEKHHCDLLNSAVTERMTETKPSNIEINITMK